MRQPIRGADFYRAKNIRKIESSTFADDRNAERTHERKARKIERNKDYAVFMNERTKAWSGLTIPEYKEVKVLKKENLRDTMTNIESISDRLMSSK